jgi:hypothetical protein
MTRSSSRRGTACDSLHACAAMHGYKIVVILRASERMLSGSPNRQAVKRYGLDQWNATRIDAEIAAVAACGKHWNVPLTCNEFGVYRQTANPTDRAA